MTPPVARPTAPDWLDPADRPSRRRRPANASWACFWSVDLLSRRFAADVLLPLTIVLLLVAAVIGAVGLTYVAL